VSVRVELAALSRRSRDAIRCGVVSIEIEIRSGRVNGVEEEGFEKVEEDEGVDGMDLVWGLVGL
jgi:hypothetical protein